MTRVLGFTGTRKGMTRAQRLGVLHAVEHSTCSEVHHGDCIGADAEFHDLVSRMALGVTIVIHPSNCETMRAFKGEGEFDTLILPPKPPLERNRDIVGACDLLLAAPFGLTEAQRSGTWATIRYARSLKKPMMIVYPDGNIEATSPLSSSQSAVREFLSMLREKIG